jgi:CDP-glucose 4,6-dehydratase
MYGYQKRYGSIGRNVDWGRCSMEKMVIDINFFKDKKVFITGHTGFKGTWLCKILSMYRAKVTGYSLEPNTNPNLFTISKINESINSIIGDIRDFEKLKNAYDDANPEIVIHLAAQPLVRESYIDPKYTYETNVIGTVNLFECIRQAKEKPKSVLNVTTDKVYLNHEWEWGYREDEQLDGYDPYSNSKSCSELVTHSYINSFFKELKIPVSTARAGNVIGGGDFSKDRIIPDCVRAAFENKDIVVRNPYSIRPYQHVLEPLFAYLMILEKQYKDIKYSGFYNVGPDECDCVTTGELVGLFCKKWGNNIKWIDKYDCGSHEASFLKLDCSKLKKIFGWKPKMNIEKAIEMTVEWSKMYFESRDIIKCMEKQIWEFSK